MNDVDKLVSEMDDVTKVIFNSASHVLLAASVRRCVDALNDAVAECVRGGLSVMVEVIEAQGSDDDLVRPIVRVEPHVVIRY